LDRGAPNRATARARHRTERRALHARPENVAPRYHQFDGRPTTAARGLVLAVVVSPARDRFLFSRAADRRAPRHTRHGALPPELRPPGLATQLGPRSSTRRLTTLDVPRRMRRGRVATVDVCDGPSRAAATRRTTRIN